MTRRPARLVTAVLTLAALVHLRAARPGDADDRGATATEYAMLVAFIAVAIAASVTLFGGKLSTFFGTIAGSIGIG